MTEKGEARKGEYFVLMPDTRRGGRGHGVVFSNVDRLLEPPRRILRPAEGGFPLLTEKPQLRLEPGAGDPPEDLEGGMSGYWLVSERLKDAFEGVDPDGFEFVECEYTLQDGSVGPRYFLCDITRKIDALDEGASKLNIKRSDEYPGGKYYSLGGGVSLAFRPEAVGDAHVFRTPYSGNVVFCDAKLRGAVIAAGMGQGSATSGVWIEDASDY